MATILFLYGDDTFRSGQKLAAIKNRYIDSSLGDTNLAIVDGATVTFDELVRQIQALPFLAKTRLVVVKNLLVAGRKEVQEAVVDYLPKVPSSTVLLMYEAGQPDKRTKLFHRLNVPKVAESFDGLTGSALQAWITQAATTRGLTLSSPVREQLVMMIGNNLWRFSNELDKLAAYQAASPEKVIDLTVLEQLITHDPTSDVFRLVEAIARRDLGKAYQELTTLIEQGEAELYLFSMIVYQFRTLVSIREAMDNGDTQSGAIARRLKINPYVVDKTMNIARLWTFDRLLDVYERLLAYDYAMKTGQLEARIALELLISETVTAAPSPSA